MHDFAFATTTWIRNATERTAVLDSLDNLNKLQLPIFVADAGSSPDDQKRLQSFSNVHFFTETGLTKQLLLVHKKAAEKASAIFYLQSDKHDFVKKYVSPMIEKYNSLETKGILIPSRTAESLQTYLPYQRTVEEFLNFFVSDYVGKPEDYYAGPKIYPSSLLSYLDSLHGDVGWGVEAFLYVIAKRLDIPFDFLSVTFTAPKDVDSSEETKRYRLETTQKIIQAFLQAQKLPL